MTLDLIKIEWEIRGIGRIAWGRCSYLRLFRGGYLSICAVNYGTLFEAFIPLTSSFSDVVIFELARRLGL